MSEHATPIEGIPAARRTTGGSMNQPSEAATNVRSRTFPVELTFTLLAAVLLLVGAFLR
jgi:hypothetical protein